MPITNPKGELTERLIKIYAAVFSESGDGTKRSNVKKGNHEHGGDGLI